MQTLGNHEPLIVISEYVECGSVIYPDSWMGYSSKQLEEFEFECSKVIIILILWFLKWVCTFNMWNECEDLQIV